MEAQQEPDTHALHIGAYLSRGDYGEEVDTDIAYFPLSYERSSGDWIFQLTVPQLRVSGLGNVLVNVGGIERAIAGVEETTESGIGDVIASAIYQFPATNNGRPFLSLRLDIKVPTASESAGLGTGKTDYSLQMDISQQVGNNLVFATTGYNFRGENALYPGMENSAFAQIGLARNLGSSVSMGVIYDYREAASSFSDETHELAPYATWNLTERWSFTGLTVWGFTDASADFAVLGQLSYRW